MRLIRKGNKIHFKTLTNLVNVKMIILLIHVRSTAWFSFLRISSLSMNWFARMHCKLSRNLCNNRVLSGISMLLLLNVLISHFNFTGSRLHSVDNDFCFFSYNNGWTEKNDCIKSFYFENWHSFGVRMRHTITPSIFGWIDLN